MDQQKIGSFLKQLRKEKGLTQEELAEKFYVSSKTVSRWETGSNMPDLSILIELSEFYEVDIRDLIDGERKADSTADNRKDALKKVAEYAEEEKNKEKKRFIKMTVFSAIACALFLIPSALFHGETTGLLYDVVPHNIRSTVIWSTYILASIGIPYSWAFLLQTLKNEYVQENERKKHNIINILCGVMLFFVFICNGLFDKTYGLVYDTVPVHIIDALLLVSNLILSIVIVYLGFVFHKSMKTHNNKKR